MTLFLGINSVAWVLLFLVWGRKTWTNMFIKIGLFGLGSWSTFLWLKALGFIVKI